MSRPTRACPRPRRRPGWRQFGPNRFTAAETESRLHAFLRQYADPMQLVLLVAGIGSLYPLKEVGTGILLLLLTVFNAVLGLRQEGKAAAAVAALQKMMIVTARVRRDGALAQLPAEQLVPGDIVAIEAGDIVPADGRLLRAATLEVAESALTGESLPVSKGTAAVAQGDTPLGDRTDMVYMNTNVTRGSGELVVVATGMATEVGHISGMLQSEKETKTPLTRQLDTLTRQIFLIAGLALLVSVVINLARGETFTAIFHAAVAFAIGALPENMPAVVTTILAYGTQALAKVGAIMKRLQSTETLGSTSAINSDKTGTLTLNEMTAVEMVVVGRRYAIEGTGYSSQGQITHVAGQGAIPLDPFLLPMVLASDAVMDQGALIGDPTEGALVALAAKGGVDAVSTRHAYPRVAELPFDAAYKLMATFHRMTDDSGAEVVRCFVKGAPDELLSRAGTVHDADVGARPADGELRERYLAENARLGAEGLRVLATARKDFDPTVFDPDGDLLVAVSDGLELLSLVGIVDPPRPTAKASIAIAESAGIRVRMITGDHAVTAGAIAGKLGIRGSVMTGAEFAALDDDEALERIDEVGVIARVTPAGQGPAGGPAQEAGPDRRDDRRRGERRARAQERRHRDRDGHHRNRGRQGCRRDGADRRQLLDHRQGRRAGARPVRQPREVHPVPDGLPLRLHRLLPRRGDLQHRRRRPVPAPADAVDQLHHDAVPGGRSGLRAACRGPDGPPPPRPRTADPAAPADGLARRRRPHHRWRHPRGRHLGRARVRPHRGPDDGSRDLLTGEPAVLPRHQGRGPHRLLAGHAVGQDLHPVDAPCRSSPWSSRPCWGRCRHRLLPRGEGDDALPLRAGEGDGSGREQAVLLTVDVRAQHLLEVGDE